MTALPDILTVAQVLRSRRVCRGLFYRGCELIYLDWHPSPDGTHHAVTIDNQEHWLEPETWLEVNSNVAAIHYQRTDSQCAE